MCPSGGGLAELSMEPGFLLDVHFCLVRWCHDDAVDDDDVLIEEDKERENGNRGNEALLERIEGFEQMD